MRRLATHGLLALTLAALLLAVAAGGDASARGDRLSIVTAYLCLSLLMLTLLAGPIRVLRQRATSVNYYRRRDLGIWCACMGLCHFFLANELAMNREYIDLVVNQSGSLPASLRSNLYTAGALMGYLLALNFALLLALSNDWSMRLLGVRWWKCLQRSAYLVLIATVGHALAFQLLESRRLPWILVVCLVLVVVVAAKLQSIRLPRQK